MRTGDDPHGGLTFLVLRKDDPGVKVERALKKTGWCSSDTAELFFDDVRVPVSRRVSSEGAAFILLMRNFQTERLALAAYGVATAEIACEEAIAWAKERKVFGKSLNRFSGLASSTRGYGYKNHRSEVFDVSSCKSNGGGTRGHRRGFDGEECRL